MIALATGNNKHSSLALENVSYSKKVLYELPLACKKTSFFAITSWKNCGKFTSPLKPIENVLNT
jgi:hypothetical protein